MGTSWAAPRPSVSCHAKCSTENPSTSPHPPATCWPLSNSGGSGTNGAGAMPCDAYGGAVNRVPTDSTASVHRAPLFCIQYYGAGSTTAWIDQAPEKLRAFGSGMAYQNYIDANLANWQHAIRAPP